MLQFDVLVCLSNTDTFFGCTLLYFFVRRQGISKGVGNNVSDGTLIFLFYAA